MRIIFITHEFGESAFGGEATYAEELLKSFTGLGKNNLIMLAGSFKVRETQYFKLGKNAILIRIPYPDIPPHHIIFQFKIPRYIQTINTIADLVHSNSISISLLTSKINKPVIVSIHGSLSSYMYSLMYGSIDIKDLTFNVGELPILIKMYKKCFNNASKLIFIAKHVLNEWLYYAKKLNLRKSEILEKSHVIPPMISMQPRIEDLLESRTKTMKNNVLKLVFAGRLYNIKGVKFIPYILEELKKIWKGKIEVHIYGSGPLKNKLERDLLKRNLRLSTKFFGKISRDIFMRYLHVYDVMIMPSIYEACPYTLIEANILGVPVIAFDLEWSKEFILDMVNGMRVPFNDVREFAEAIVKLKEADTKIRISSHQYAKQRFSSNIVLRQLMKVYQEVIE